MGQKALGPDGKVVPEGVVWKRTSNGTVRYYAELRAKNPATGKWLRVKVGGGGGGFATAREAKRAFDRAKAARDTGKLRVGGRETLAEYLTAWLADKEIEGLSVTTLVNYRQKVDGHVVPHLGAVRVSDVSEGHVRDLRARLLTDGRLENGRRDGKGAGLSAKTVRDVLGVLSTALGDAEDEGKIARNPVPRVRRKLKADAPEPRFWTPEEAGRFLAAMGNDRLFALWRLQITTEIRRAEMAGLKWNMVDFGARRIRIMATRVVVGGRAYDKVDPKSAASKRIISLDDDMIAALTAHRKAQLAEQMASPPGDWVDTGYVFTRGTAMRSARGEWLGGAPYHPEYFSQRFEKLAGRTDLPRITFHGLRHTGHTIAKTLGIDSKVAQERAGHGDERIGERYHHTWTDLHDQEARKIGEFITKMIEAAAEGQEENTQIAT